MLNTKERRTIVHEIVRSGLPEADKQLNRVFGDVATISGAGFETTANVLRLILYQIFHQPAILERIRGEISQAWKESRDHERHLEVQDLEKLPFLTAVILEGLRLAPAIGSRSQRIAPDREIVYGKWSIPAGMPIGMTAMLLHTDENVFPNPHEFLPERWLDQDMKKESEKCFAPFSKGTRMCLGLQ